MNRKRYGTDKTVLVLPDRSKAKTAYDNSDPLIIYEKPGDVWKHQPPFIYDVEGISQATDLTPDQLSGFLEDLYNDMGLEEEE